MATRRKLTEFQGKIIVGTRLMRQIIPDVVANFIISLSTLPGIYREWKALFLTWNNTVSIYVCWRIKTATLVYKYRFEDERHEMNWILYSISYVLETCLRDPCSGISHWCNTATRDLIRGTLLAVDHLRQCLAIIYIETSIF